nr:MAG: hypothetical protein DIU58_14740 [Sphaerobacter thermophilus]
MIDQVNTLTADARSDALVTNDFNRGLIELAPILLLQERFEQAWAAGTESVPAPANVLWFRDTARFIAGGNDARLPRVAVHSNRPGFWYDGASIGIRPIPQVDGTFIAWYVRQPNLLDPMQADAEPEGGAMVAQALIEYACAQYYREVGDEESLRLANGFYNAYLNVRAQIEQQRRRLMNATGDWSFRGDG